jgi:hypothetical protein
MDDPVLAICRAVEPLIRDDPAAHEELHKTSFMRIPLWASEVYPRLLELCDRYRIPRPTGESDAWLALAVRLAIEHKEIPHPVPKGPGTLRSARTLLEDCVILAELGKTEPNGRSVSAAARRLAKLPQFKGRSPRSINTRYYELRRNGIAMGGLVEMDLDQPPRRMKKRSVR